MSYNSSRGFYGDSYDRHVPLYNDQSTIYKMKETYWTTKQAVMRKLGKKEDEHIVASDSELDAKLEVFKAIQKSSMDLLRVIEKYQDRICVLSREENGMGRLLKSESQHDKTRAGKMMAAVGKAQCFSSQQMLQLRAPLVRLYQEVETFRYRAITDTLITVKRMEAARTEYRGTLLWMKDVSNELDPDTSKQLQKFRTVQAQVKKTKAKFDKLKLDVMQKIDLLAASRCNMFSHVLAKYQSTLLHFWEKTAFRMTAVADSFKGYQYYEFSMLKELGEPSKKLAEETGGADSMEKDVDDSQDEFSNDDEYDDARFAKRMRQEDDKEVDQEEITSDHLPRDSNASNEEHTPVEELDQLVGVTGDNSSPTVDLKASGDFVVRSSSSDENLFSLEPIPLSTAMFSTNSTLSNLAELIDSSGLASTALPSDISKDPPESHFLDHNIFSELPSQSNAPCQTSSVFTFHEHIRKRTSQPIANKNDSLNNLFLDGNKQKTGDFDAFIDFGDDEEVDLEEIKRKQDEEFDFTGMLKQSAAANKKQKQGADSKNVLDLLSDDMENIDLSDKDDMTILNEILNAPPTGDDFSQEWNAVFGNSTPLSPTTSNAQALAPDRNLSSFPSSGDVMSSQFMPSSLLEMTSASYGGGFNMSTAGQPMKSSIFNMTSSGLQQQQQMGTNLFGGVPPLAPISTASSTAQKQQPMAKKKNNKQELSAWFNLFAELDPLANPDAIGRKNDDVTDA